MVAHGSRLLNRLLIKQYITQPMQPEYKASKRKRSSLLLTYGLIHFIILNVNTIGSIANGRSERDVYDAF